MKKRILSMFLTLALAFCMGTTAFLVCSETVSAAEQNDGTYKYTVDSNGNAKITGLVNPTVTTGIDLVIPNEIMGSKVTSIASNAFKGNTYIRSVTFSSNLLVIGDNAFNGCNYIESVDIPASVTTIGSGAFSGCANLSSLTLNAGSSLVIGSNAFENTAVTSVVFPANVTEIGNNAFLDCLSLKNIVINEGITTIGSSAFENCNILEGDLVIPASVTKFNSGWGASNAFKNTRISSVSFAESDAALVIPDSAFANNKYLTKVTIGSRVSEIGDSAFEGCPNLSSVTFEEGTIKKTIGSSAFKGCSVNSVVFPSNISVIGDSAFEECLKLTSISLTEGLETLGCCAFNGCTSLAGDIVIPTSLTKFISYFGSSSAFKNTAITSFSFTPGSLANIVIPESICEGCTKLTSVQIADRVTEIGGHAFKGCTALSKIEFEAGKINKTIGEYAFEGCVVEEIDIPGTVTTVGSGAFRECKKLTKLKLNEGLKEIGNEAFYGCIALSGDLVIPSTVTKFGTSWGSSKAFTGTAITSVELLDSDASKEISGYLFYGCEYLKYAIIPSSVTEISDKAFAECPCLTWVSIASNDYSNLTIGSNAFLNDRNLKAISVPKRITTIENAAFKGCALLKDVYVDNSEAEYNSNITVKKNNDLYTGATFHFNSKGPDTWPTATYTGWRTVNDYQVWYEDDVLQGTEGRGKEIYDGGSDAWYWLDAPTGAKAVSKDVYQESLAGIWGDVELADGTRIGKWVRYDENGKMIKGWSNLNGNRYYFDEQFGTMAKGFATIEGTEYFFNTATGALEETVAYGVPSNGWRKTNDGEFWYENGQRQGVSPNASYRGKEIFDPDTNAWYWLDNAFDGKKAVSKDVYQESFAGDWGDIDNGDGTKSGKWVRYDENGHMVKGWNQVGNDVYYFDPVYGTMAKGPATIDGRSYYFDENTGILR